MNIDFFTFRESLFPQGIFSTDHIKRFFPGFNTDNLLNWQKKEYIFKLRNKWYCFREVLSTPDADMLIANEIYSPSYISHQQALMFYGLIPEHIVSSTSVTTKKTNTFEVRGRKYAYYSVKPALFFGYHLLPVTLNGLTRYVKIAEKEKAILDLLYLYKFYKTRDDIEQLRFNEHIMQEEVNWLRLSQYADRFGFSIMKNKVSHLKALFEYD